jgi:hypothetical protein
MSKKLLNPAIVLAQNIFKRVDFLNNAKGPSIICLFVHRDKGPVGGTITSDLKYPAALNISKNTKSHRQSMNNRFQYTLFDWTFHGLVLFGTYTVTYWGSSSAISFLLLLQNNRLNTDLKIYNIQVLYYIVLRQSFSKFQLCLPFNSQPLS